MPVAMPSVVMDVYIPCVAGSHHDKLASKRVVPSRHHIRRITGKRIQNILRTASENIRTKNSSSPSRWRLKIEPFPSIG